MYIDITGYTSFTIYVRSYAESTYDYVTVYNLDTTNSIIATTSGSQSGNTSLSNYKAVTFTDITPGTHTITIAYSKDSSVNSNYADRGFLLIPKNQ